MIPIEVLGTPAPKGSNRAMMRRGSAVFVPGGSRVNQDKLMSWDVAVRAAAIKRIGRVNAPPFVGVPLVVAITFRMRRPVSHYSKKTKQLLPSVVDSQPATTPDIDKLTRSTLDSLTRIVYDDDARIVEAHVRKVYAAPNNEGASITVAAWAPSIQATARR